MKKRNVFKCLAVVLLVSCSKVDLSSSINSEKDSILQTTMNETIINETNSDGTTINQTTSNETTINQTSSSNSELTSGTSSSESFSSNINISSESIYKESSILSNDSSFIVEELIGGYESITLKYKSEYYNDFNCYYSINGNDFIKVDSKLIRSNRIDILGLEGDKEYFIKLVPVLNNQEINGKSFIVKQKTLSYDRSGYAHFKYENGVGAYQNNGTLKQNAIVIYLDNENKNNIVIPCFEDCGKGIGWILNNNPTGCGKIFKDHSLVVRILGKVDSPEGSTIKNSTENGGAIGDNGNMVRIKNASNITFEGVGNDAELNGWGIHFLALKDYQDSGYNFEVRNLTFSQYTEDALGAEGEMLDSKTLASSVERVWIHHNKFNIGHCDDPSGGGDKADGDGACDLKRGQYFTVSYNIFNACHKTSLVGSDDDQPQYNVTYHHNIFKECDQRNPLVRKANLHSYNNYYLNGLSNCYDLRGDAYVFSEANYFENIRSRICRTKSNGTGKSFNDIIDCTKSVENALIIVSKREESISNTNKYPNFDTDENIFYYDVIDNKSNVKLLTDAYQAKIDCLNLSGPIKY